MELGVAAGRVNKEEVGLDRGPEESGVRPKLLEEVLATPRRRVGIRGARCGEEGDSRRRLIVMEVKRREGLASNEAVNNDCVSNGVS